MLIKGKCIGHIQLAGPDHPATGYPVQYHNMKLTGQVPDIRFNPTIDWF